MNIARTGAAFVLVFAMAMLTACGGGGSSDGGGSALLPAHSTATGTSTAQGLYSGASSNGSDFIAIILDNDEYYAIYASSDGSTAGIIQGNGQSGNGSFSSDNLADFSSNGLISGSLTASYVPDVSFSGTITEEGTSFTIDASAVPSSEFNYDTLANLANIAGNWTYQGTVSLYVDASGNFSGSSGGCSFNGTLQPRASGKNVFDMSLAFGPSPCLLANQSESGIAIETSNSDGTQDLLMIGVTDARTDGTFILVSKAALIQ